MVCVLPRVLCVSRQYFSAKFARPLFSDRFTLRLLLTRYFALYSARRVPGRAVHTEPCSLSRKLIILFVTDNKYFMADSRQSHSAQIVLKDKNYKDVLIRKYLHDHLFVWCHLLEKERLLHAVVVMNMQVSCNKAINMPGWPPGHALFRQFSYLIARLSAALTKISPQLLSTLY